MVNPSFHHVEEVINNNFERLPHYTVENVIPVDDKGYSFSPSTKIYMVDLSRPHDLHASERVSCIAFLTIGVPASTSSAVPSNSLATISALMKTHLKPKLPFHTSISILDTSRTYLPYDCILSHPAMFTAADVLPLSAAKQRMGFSPEDLATIDKKVGQLLGQIHARVQNDWFGRPSPSGDAPTEPSYSWQETFIAMIDDLISRMQSEHASLDLPFADIRQYESRAIAFFLFDDVSVPSLVWLTGSEDDVYVRLTQEGELELVAVLPSLAHAAWGDPLLETFFLPSPPSEALMEGYIGGGGEPLLTFPRQKTKRIWYTLYLAMLVLLEQGRSSDRKDKREWAIETIRKCAKDLRDAPCY